MGVLRRVETYFLDKGLRKSDIPKAFFIHEVLGILMLALTWSTCYRFPLSSNPTLWTPIENMFAKAPLFSKSVSNRISQLPFPPRVTEAYLESSCFRKIIRPVTFPGKMLLTYKIVQAWSRGETSIEEQL